LVDLTGVLTEVGMFGLGTQELVIIFLIVIVIFGANKIPQLGKGLGEGIKNFKNAMKAGQEEDADKKEKS
jgi:sec-independent protein translocase protein TatA